MNELLGLVDLVLSVGHDQAVQILLLVASMGSIRPTLTLLDRALSTDGDLGARLCFHLLQSVSTRSNQQTDLMKERLVLVHDNIIASLAMAVRQVSARTIAPSIAKRWWYLLAGFFKGSGEVVRKVRGLAISLKLISG